MQRFLMLGLLVVLLAGCTQDVPSANDTIVPDNTTNGEEIPDTPPVVPDEPVPLPEPNESVVPETNDTVANDSAPLPPLRYAIQPLPSIQDHDIEFDNLLSLRSVETPAAAINAKRRMVVVWVSQNPARQEILAMQQLKEDGTLVGIPVTVATNSGDHLANPTIAFLDNETLVLTYDQINADDDAHVVARILLLDGTLQEEILITQPGQGRARNSFVTTDGNGNFLVLWSDGDLKGRMFYYSRGTRSATVRLDELPSTFAQDHAVFCDDDEGPSDTSVVYPHATFAPNGQAFIVWGDEKRAVPSQGENFFVRGPFSVVGKRVLPGGGLFSTLQSDFMVDDLNLPCAPSRRIANAGLAAVQSNNASEWWTVHPVITFNYTTVGRFQGWLKMSDALYNFEEDIRAFDPDEPPLPIIGRVESHLFLKIFSPDGEELVARQVDEGSVLVHPFVWSPEWRYWPTIGLNNNVLIVWTDIREDRPEVYGRFFNNSGDPLDNDFRIAREADSPFAVANRWGDYFVFYRSLDEDEPGLRVAKIDTS